MIPTVSTSLKPREITVAWKEGISPDGNRVRTG